jgi:CRISPR-associated protein Csb1
VFPPTYAGAVYATEKRRLPGKADPVDCVLLDSVQSLANRIEDALQQAIDGGALAMPLIVVNFGDAVADVWRVTSLQAPHRAADAILRDSLTDQKDDKGKPLPFRKSEVGTAITNSSLANATGLFQYCPHALILGIWDSTGPKGGLGAKFARALVSEIVGIDIEIGARSRSRIDPLQIGLNAGPIYRLANGGWTIDPDEAIQEEKNGKLSGKACLYRRNKQKQNVYFEPGPLFENAETKARAWTYHPKLAKVVRETPATVTVKLFGENDTVEIGKDLLILSVPSSRIPKEGKPSSANHGNVTPDTKDEDGTELVGGVTLSHAEHTAVLSLPQLRRLRFPIEKLPEGKTQMDVDNAARTVLAALALVGLTLSLERGCDLRSRCLLFPEGPLSFELLETPGKPTPITLDSTQAIGIYKQAVDAARNLGLPWDTTPITLEPSPELIALVKKSQELAAVGGEDEGE